MSDEILIRLIFVDYEFLPHFGTPKFIHALCKTHSGFQVNSS
jgi:hypothetical protein